MDPSKVVVTGCNILPASISDQNQLNANNLQEIKILMVSNSGLVYQKPNEIVVQYKSEFQEHMAQIAM